MSPKIEAIAVTDYYVTDAYKLRHVGNDRQRAVVGSRARLCDLPVDRAVRAREVRRKATECRRRKRTRRGPLRVFDLLAEGYWGGFITGDKVTIDFSPEGPTDGLQGRLVRQVGRYAGLEQGEDKLSCAGTMESYVCGMIDL
ncbi:hypothetical protein PQQ64_29265 [Paraburkholderia graminis]|uniref:hypothetical protein n=1 Tax=Paraburkholderia graminis TaxID=60548 RepID=UPI0038BAF1B6